MPSELTYLAWSVILLLVHVVAQASAGALDLGLPYLATARDEERKPASPLAGRLGRALANFLETYPAFIALALGLVAAGKAGGMGATGAMLWFWARVVYLPLYAAGAPFVRTLCWIVSLVGLVMMLIRMLS